MPEGAGFYGVIGLLVTVLGLPLWGRRIGPNRYYGIRTAATLSNERRWYDVNAAAGRDMTLAGLATLGCVAALVGAGLQGTTFELVMAMVLVLGAAIVSFRGLAASRRSNRRQ